MVDNSKPTNPTPESRSPELIVVYDNNPYDNKLYTAHGFSCLVRLTRKTILFDTGGDSSTLLYNLGKLEIDPGEVDDVFLSHIDGDHTGGLGGFLEQNRAVTIYLPQSFPKYFKEEIISTGVKVKEVSAARELLPGVYTTGELGGGIIEQSLVVRTSQGLVVMTGCAHPGIVKIIGKAKEVVPGNRVYLAIGGFHLSGTSPAQIEAIISNLLRLGVYKAAPCHCSGNEARRLFEKNYGANYMEVGAGKRIPLPLIYA